MADTIEVRRFERIRIKVADPQRVGNTVTSYIWAKAGDTSLSVNGRGYVPNASGWFEVAPEDASELLKSPFWQTRVGAAGLAMEEPADDYPEDDEDSKPVRRGRPPKAR